MQDRVSIPLPAAALLALGLAAFGCRGKATSEECDQMLDRYLTMTIQRDPELARLSPREQEAAKAMKAALKKQEPSFKKVKEQCLAEIRKSEYDCAMKAPDPEQWEACID